MEKYDILILGCGPGGQKAAIQAGKFNKKVGIVEEHANPGGFCTHTGTIPSKTLKFAADFFGGLKSNLDHAEANKAFQDSIFQRLSKVISREEEIAKVQLERNGVDLIQGVASFVGPKELEVTKDNKVTKYQADVIIIATGSRPVHPENVDFSEKGPIYDSDTILSLSQLPGSVIIEGGGVIGSEYASIFCNLGVKVTLVNRHPNILNFIDEDIRTQLEISMKDRGIQMYMNTQIKKYNAKKDHVVLDLSNGESIQADCALICSGRRANVEKLGLEHTKVKLTKRSTIETDENFQTAEPGIYAIGDVIGFPSLAAAAMVHGRMAMRHVLKLNMEDHTHSVIPMGIWTVPELSCVGKTEQQLKQEGVTYEVGQAGFKELARSQIDDNREGLLKILFCPESRKILGVHILGRGACDLIHLGQAVMALGGTIDFFIQHPANFPTYSGAYKVAAINCLNKIS